MEQKRKSRFRKNIPVLTAVALVLLLGALSGLAQAAAACPR